MSYHLFLDDGRQPEDVKWLELPPLAWVVVHDYKEFVNAIRTRGIPATVSFDHDLCQEHYDEYTCAHDPRMLSFGTIRYHIFKEKTGYECAKYLAEECVCKDVPIPTYYIHTLNPIGKANILNALEPIRKILTELQQAGKLTPNER
jgi:hypothetical protein